MICKFTNQKLNFICQTGRFGIPMQDDSSFPHMTNPHPQESDIRKRTLDSVGGPTAVPPQTLDGRECPTANFDRPFTPRTRLRSPRNFAKTRFGRFPAFHFSTPQIFSKLRTAGYPWNKALIDLKLCQNTFQTIPDVSFFDAKKKSAKISDPKIRFALIWRGF